MSPSCFSIRPVGTGHQGNSRSPRPGTRRPAETQETRKGLGRSEERYRVRRRSQAPPPRFAHAAGSTAATNMGASRTRATAFALACLSVLGLVAFLGTGAPTAGAAAEGCPNAGAPGVGFLPECRAWEMVSPTDKNGGHVMPISSRTRAARDGEAVTFVSPPGVAGAQGSGAGFA